MDALKREKMKIIFQWVFHGNDRAQKRNEIYGISRM